MEKIKYFISLPITGRVEKAKEIANAYKSRLISIYPNIDFITPFDITGGSTDKADSYYMGRCIEALMDCEGVISDYGWQDSKGCKVERFVANTYGLRVYEIDEAFNNELFNEKINI